MLLAFASAASLAAPESDLEVKVRIVGDEIHADVSLFVRAPQQRVWEVITDYERAPEYTRDLQVSRIVARSADTVRLFQRAHVRLGPFAIPIETLKDIRLMAPFRTESRLVDGTLKRHDTTTELIRDGGGTRVIVRSVAISDSPFAGLVGEGTIKRETEQRFRELRAEILRRSQVAARTARPGATQ